ISRGLSPGNPRYTPEGVPEINQTECARPIRSRPFRIDPQKWPYRVTLMFRKCFLFAAFASLLASFGSARAADDAKSAVEIAESPDKLTVKINGELFTEYHFKGAPHVYFYPLIRPGSLAMTRNWPMKDVPGE